VSTTKKASAALDELSERFEVLPALPGPETTAPLPRRSR
jgi:hypothetical protein